MAAHVEPDTRISFTGHEPTGGDSPWVSVRLGAPPAEVVLLVRDVADLDRLRAVLAEARVRLCYLRAHAEPDAGANTEMEAAGQPATC